METRSDLLPPAGLFPLARHRRLEFSYDGQGRRVSKKVFNWSPGGWVLAKSSLFLYDGWNLIADLNALSGNSASCTYAWGLDLSGSMQGAGGVGGLLFTNLFTANSSPLAAHSVSYDGNGNVIGLVDMATGTKSATYDYNAFGETIQSEGVAALANPFRFSTKYTDDETGLLYYGFRYYVASTGRWPNRDPIQEEGGINLYGFCSNSIGSYDRLGLENVGVWVTSFIRPPDPQPGTKTIHQVIVDDKGSTVSITNLIGTTDYGVLGKQPGHASFSQSVSKAGSVVTVKMKVGGYPTAFPVAGSSLGSLLGVGPLPGAYLGTKIGIFYDFEIKLDFCSREGELTGSHHSYPSYGVRVKGSIYESQQQSYSGWFGISPNSVSKKFKF